MYNIPVCVWLLDTHPYNSPMCYVKPTAYMQIKVSRHVDQTGRVFLPYLHEWNPVSVHAATTTARNRLQMTHSLPSDGTSRMHFSVVRRC